MSDPIAASISGDPNLDNILQKDIRELDKEKECDEHDHDNDMDDQDISYHGTSDHFSKQDWKFTIEPKVKAVVDMLAMVTLNNNKVIFPDTTTTIVSFLGDLFNHARNKTKPQTNYTNGKKNQGNGIAIRNENNLKHVKKKIDQINKFFVIQKKNWNFSYIPCKAFGEYEIRGYFLLKAMYYTSDNYTSKIEENVYELLIIV